MDGRKEGIRGFDMMEEQCREKGDVGTKKEMMRGKYQLLRAKLYSCG